MELRQWNYFIKAAELQNFNEASGALFITQSTLSQQIKQLEDELGLPARFAYSTRMPDIPRMIMHQSTLHHPFSTFAVIF